MKIPASILVSLSSVLSAKLISSKASLDYFPCQICSVPSNDPALLNKV